MNFASSPLQGALRQAAAPVYPLHMPGHKRRMAPAPDLPFSWDTTEVPGVDDLHEADGILKDAMDRTATLHGAARTWYLVNGSTCGLMAGIRALAPFGSTVIAARNCHKAVYHALELGQLSVRWLMPPIDPGSGVCGSISPQTVAAALSDCPEAACVILTSPTYEGVLSDIRSIAGLCHARGVPLLVDEAHGAHLGLFPGWPLSAIRSGADLVVQSAHKTLPSLTQTALLHLGPGSLADPEEVERQLGIFETSSPSYPLLVSLDGCTGLLLEEGAALFGQWREGLDRFNAEIAALNHFRVLCHGADSLADHPGFFRFDPGKLTVSAAGTNLTGAALAQVLRERFQFETEMHCGDILLAMTSPCDDPAELLRFAQALATLDREAQSADQVPPILLPPPGEGVTPIAQALRTPSQAVAWEEAAGRISGEFLWAYPPGVPLIAPGERISRDFLESAQALVDSGTALRHSHCKKPGRLQVLA